VVRPTIAAISALAALLLVLSALVNASPLPAAQESASGKPTEIRCLDRSGRSHVAKSLPRRCTLFGPGGAFAGGVNLAQLNWHGWGQPRATAQGIEKGFHLPASHISVQVTAFERVGCGSVYRYAKLRATSRYGTTTATAPTC
jgi:hypothetical protein